MSSAPSQPSPQRRSRNHGGYHGERLDVAATNAELQRAAAAHAWSHHTLLDHPEHSVFALVRSPQNPTASVYISSGIHGDEPAGPLALLELLRDNRWPPSLALFLCPCLNPTGFPLNRRENHLGHDLNRDYKHLRTQEIIAHTQWLNNQPRFDLTLCLHEDWESHGFYLYELNPDNQPSLAPAIITAVRPLCPIDESPLIDGRPAHQGIIRPNADPSSRPEWPEAFYLLQRKTRLSYTLEAPSDFDLPVRVAALRAAVLACLNSLPAR